MYFNKILFWVLLLVIWPLIVKANIFTDLDNHDFNRKYKFKTYKVNKSKNTKDTVVIDMGAFTPRKKALFARKNSVDFTPNPRIAAIFSAILPGAGQIYNRAYWKAPLVWAAVGGMGYLVLDNFIWYRRAGFAFLAKQKSDQGDRSLLPRVNPLFTRLSTVATKGYRNKFREDVDLYGLLLLVVWGLNVMEAAVHAHLKGFDVSPKLSLYSAPQILPTPFANAYGWGVSLRWHDVRASSGNYREKSIFRDLSPIEASRVL